MLREFVVDIIAASGNRSLNLPNSGGRELRIVIASVSIEIFVLMSCYLQKGLATYEDFG